MNLEALAAEEEEVAAAVARCTGTMDDRHQLLDSMGVFERYRRIHLAYLSIGESAAAPLEAVKRATFLSWYEQAEPACFTGIFDLDSHTTSRAYVLLDRRLRTIRLDTELTWMLPWYHFIAPWVLDFIADPNHQLTRIRQVTEALPPTSWHSVLLPNLHGRGALGAYWQSLFRPHLSNPVPTANNQP